MPDARRWERRQKVLADFGEFALRSNDLDAVLTQACHLVAQALGTGHAKVLEIERERRTLLVRAGVGWDDDVVGHLRLPMDATTSETFSIDAGEPVITNDRAEEERFDFPAFLKNAGIEALANVPILLPGGRPFGLLQVDASEPRAFDDADSHFLRTYATLLGPVIDRLLTMRALSATEQRFRSVVEAARDYAIFQTDPQDHITEWLAGAETVFGWKAGEAIGQPAAIVFTPEDRQAGVPQAEIRRAREQGFAPNMRWHVRKDGSRVFINGSVVPLRDEEGRLRGFQKVGQDVTKNHLAQEALRESEARHSLLIGSWAQAVWETDAAGVVVADSPSWRAHTGQTLKEWLGYGWLDAVHPDDRAYAERQWHEAIAARGLVDVEFRLRSPDGGWRWTNVRAAPVLDAHGAIAKWAGMNIDIDARRQAEAALRESEERLRQFGEASQDVLWIRNAASLQWEYLSPAFEAIYGVPVADALTGETLRNWTDLIVEDDREAAVACIDRVRHGEPVAFEYRIRRPDGQLRWLRDTDFPMRDAAGQVQRIGGVGQDVTRLKVVQAALTESEGRLRTLTEGMPQLVWRSADEGHWTWSSPQWQAYTGQTPEQSRDLGWLEAVHADDRPATLTAWKAAWASGLLEVEHRIRRARDGEHVWHHTRSLPARDPEGHVVEWLGTTTDVQQLKELQQRQAVMVAELQHRTRNLIAVVRSVGEQTMARTGPTEAFREEFNDRLEALARVQGLLSRSDEAPITIGALIQMELDAMGAKAGSGRVGVNGPPVRIRHSVVQTLALALHELATNARKYGALSGGRGRLEISWRTYADEKGSRLALHWLEVGGLPPKPGDHAHQGYGRELIERALPYSLNARTSFEHDEAGLRCTIDMPLERSRDRRRTA